MSVTIRGGFPKVFRATVTTAAVRHHLFEGVTSAISIRVKSNPVRVYFSEADATAGTGYLEVEAADDRLLPAEIQQCWMLAVGGDAQVELIKFLRHG